MKIKQTTWILEPINGFKQIKIVEDHRGFTIIYEYQGPLGVQCVVDFKNSVSGGWAYMANEKEIDEQAVFYSSLEECFAAIKENNPKNIKKLLDKDYNKNRYLFSEK